MDKDKKIESLEKEIKQLKIDIAAIKRLQASMNKEIKALKNTVHNRI